MSVNLSPNIVWEIRRGGISTSDTTYENDGECLRHWLGHVTRVYFTYRKQILADLSKN